MLDALRRRRLLQQCAAASVLVVAAVGVLLALQLRLRAADDARRTTASLKQLAGLLQDVAGPGEPAAVPALVRGWLHTETGVVRVVVRDREGRLLAEAAHAPEPALQSRHHVPVRLASGDRLDVDVVMDDTAAAVARHDLILEDVGEALVLVVGAWALLLFAAARRAAVRRYRMLLATSRLLLSGASEDDLLQRLCALAVGEGGFVLAWIGLPGADGTVVPTAVAGPASGYLEGFRMSIDPESAYGQGVGGRALRDGATVCSNDFARDPAMAPWLAAARTHGIRASIGVPLRHDGKVIGLLSLYRAEAGWFTAAEAALVEQMAADIALGIDYLRRGARLADTVERLARIETQVRAGSFRFRLPEGSLWCSEGAGRLLGRPAGTSRLPAPADATADVDPAVALYDLAAATPAGELEFDLPLAMEGGPVHWLRFTGALEVLAAGAIEIRGLVQDVSERKALEIGITRAADAERQRIASELHDNLGQILTGTSLLAATLESRAALADAALGEDMREVSRLLRQALKVCRTLAHGSMLDLVHGLGAALEDLARQTTATGVACEAVVTPPARALHGEQAIELYRIAQEAVTNALKHAGCMRISIELRLRGRLLDLVVADDGGGLRPGAGTGDGLGLRTMRYRAARAGGTIRFGTGPAGGLAVQVRVRLPGVAAVG
jgi:signal transduction histidine kinase